MLSTIKVPMGFGYGQVRVGGPGGLALPAPSFPQAKPSVDAEASREAPPAAAAVAPIAAAPSAAIADAKENKGMVAAPAPLPAAQAKLPRPLSAQPSNQLPVAGGKPGQFAAPIAGGYKPAPVAPIIGGGIPSRAALPGAAAIAAVNAAKGVPALGVRPSAAIGGVPLSGAILPSRQAAPIAGGLPGARPAYGAAYGNPAVAAYLNRPAVPVARAGLVGGRGF